MNKKDIQVVVLAVILCIAVACIVAVFAATKADDDAGKTYEQLSAENA